MASSNGKRNVLDLRGLIKVDSSIIDRSGRDWPIVPDLPLRSAVALLKYESEWDGGDLTLEGLEGTIDGMWAILKMASPDATRDEVIDSFTVTEMVAAIQYLSFQLRNRLQTAQQEAAVPTVPQEEMAPMELTPKPKRSRAKSAVVN